VVEAKYDTMSGCWCSKDVEGPFGVGVWKHIRRVLRVFFFFFSRFVKYEVRDGSKIRFWHDV
jgi:hypothetical protein